MFTDGRSDEDEKGPGGAEGEEVSVAFEEDEVDASLSSRALSSSAAPGVFPCPRFPRLRLPRSRLHGSCASLLLPRHAVDAPPPLLLAPVALDPPRPPAPAREGTLRGCMARPMAFPLLARSAVLSCHSLSLSLSSLLDQIKGRVASVFHLEKGTFFANKIFSSSSSRLKIGGTESFPEFSRRALLSAEAPSASSLQTNASLCD